MNTRQIDEPRIKALVLYLYRMYKAKNPKAGVPLWKDVRPIPIHLYADSSPFGKAVLNKVSSNIECGLYSAKDLRNYLILKFATGDPLSIEKLPTGHEEICAVSEALSDKRFTADKQAFRKIHEKYVREGVIGDYKVPDVYYETPDGTESMMFRLTMSGAVSPRFYLSGLNSIDFSKKPHTEGIVERTFRKFVPYLYL